MSEARSPSPTVADPRERVGLHWAFQTSQEGSLARRIDRWRKRLKIEPGWYGEPAVKWLSISQLLRTAKEVALATTFARFADQRLTLPHTGFDYFALTGRHHTGAVRVDFAADTGDGFDATLAVARLLVTGRDGRAPAEEADERTELGPPDLLILGGDEVYPVASASNYRLRLTRVFDVAWKLHGTGPQPPVLALPGNHDWYDGLVSFRRTFCESWASTTGALDPEGLVRIGAHEPPAITEKRDFAGGWRTVQTRSYFAVRVHPSWWIWGVDSQLNAPIDAPQVEYFRKAAEKLQGTDCGIIVCPATPSWREAAGETPLEFDRGETPLFTLTHFLRNVLDVNDDRVALLLTGDSHHYAHYVPEDEAATARLEKGDPDHVWASGPHLITCGGGGAFTSSTHHLPGTLSVPWGKGVASPAVLDLADRVRSISIDEVTDRFIDDAGLEPDEFVPTGEAAQPQSPVRRPVVTRYRLDPANPTYPTMDDSRGMRRDIWKVGWRNGPFFPSLIAGLLLWIFVRWLRYDDCDGLLTHWAVPVVLIAVLLAVFALAGIKGASGGRVRRWGKVSLATLGHVSLYVGCVAVALGAWHWKLKALEPGWLPWVAVFVLFWVLGPFAFSLYLLFSDLAGFHELEAISAMRRTEYKSILRLTFHDDRVHVSVVVMDKVAPARRRSVPLDADHPLYVRELDSFDIARSRRHS